MKYRVGFRRVTARVLAACAMVALTFGMLSVQSSQSLAKPRVNTLGLRGVAIKGYDAVAYFTKRAPTRGYLVKIEPNAWAIRGGRLYLNYDRSLQRTWSKKPGRYIASATKNSRG